MPASGYRKCEHRERYANNGRYTRCAVCHRERERRRYWTHVGSSRQSARERHRRWYANNPEKVRGRSYGRVGVAGTLWSFAGIETPPELKEVLITLKQLRATIRQAKKGLTP